MRRAARVDSNHSHIVSAFRKMGCSVLSLAALGAGVPDLLVAIEGTTWLVEVKFGKGEENDKQKEWADNWLGMRAVVRDIQGVENVVKMMRLSDKNGHG